MQSPDHAHLCHKIVPISYNAELTSALLAAASSAIKQQVKRMKVNLTFQAGTWWSNQNTKLQKAAFRLWVNCSRPKTGGIYRNMANTKKVSNIHCGNWRKHVEIHKENGLAAALQADKTKKSFRQKVSNRNRSPSLPTMVGGANGV